MSAISETRAAIRGFNLQIAEREKTRQHDTWGDYGRSFDAYMDDFSGVVNKRVLLRRLEAIPFPVVVDLMAPTEALATLFIHDLPQRGKLGIAVGRLDLRDDHQHTRDEQLGIHYIARDLSKHTTWDEVNHALGGRKADLIIEDGKGAWNYIPINKALYALMLDRTWRMLNPQSGILIAEIPNADELVLAGVNLRSWRDKLLNARIDFDYEADFSKDRAFLRLTKTPASPKRLPLLS